MALEHLLDFNIKWVLIGHSERWQLFGETDDIVALKGLRALKYSMKVIFCIGETTEEWDEGLTNEVLAR